jgi:uncharacterized membrane protein YeaQ/YmgE (transglycosylase-associated protein family)
MGGDYRVGILTWIIVGLIAGWLAGLVIRGGGFGLIGNIVIGILGALIGGWLAGALFGIPGAITGFDLRTIVVAFLGSVVLLFVLGLFRR